MVMTMNENEITKEIAMQIEEVNKLMKNNKLKRVDKRLMVIKMYLEGKSQNEISKYLEYSRAWVCNLIREYREKGLKEYSRHKYGGNRRNMSIEEEIEILTQFENASNSGELVVAKTIKKKFDEKLGRDTGRGYIYMLLKRHKARKLAPRTTHPKKASSEAIEASKKLTSDSGN
jgi:transposase